MDASSMEARIGPNSQVLIHFDLWLADGSAADSTRTQGKPAQFQLGNRSLSPALEAQLQGLKAGDTKRFTLQPEEAFGLPSPDNVYHFERSRFSTETEPQPGMIMLFAQPGGQEIPGMIKAVAGESVTVDFNHPLAGQVVTFDLEVMAVHPAAD